MVNAPHYLDIARAWQITRAKVTAWRSSGRRPITAEYAEYLAEKQAKVVQRVQRRAQRLAEAREDKYDDSEEEETHEEDGELENTTETEVEDEEDLVSRKRRLSDDEVTASSPAPAPKGSRSELRQLESGLQTAKQAAMVAQQHVDQLKGQLETAKQTTDDTQQQVVKLERQLQRAKQAIRDAKQQMAPLQARLEEVQGVHGLAVEASMAQVAAPRDKNAQLQAQLQEQSVQLQAANQAVRNAQLQKIEVTQQMVALQQGHLRGNEQAARQAAYDAEVKMMEAGQQKAVHEAELQQIEATLKEAAHHAAQLQLDYEHLHEVEQHARQFQPGN